MGCLRRISFLRFWLGLCGAIVAEFHAEHAPASTIVSFDETRGGLSSLADDSGYASARAMIATDFPTMTIVDTPTITTTSLTGASAAWLGSDFDNNTAITALSVSEQSALLSFVKGGGTLLLFGENDSFDSKAATANNSLFAPFGAHNTGTLTHTQSYSFPSPTTYPLSGPFGPVTSLSSSYPGWFDVLPTGAEVVADLASNSEPVIATLPAGSLGAESGAVWFFGDSGGETDGGVQAGDWQALYANILSQVQPQTFVPESSDSMIGCAGLALIAGRPRRSR